MPKPSDFGAAPARMREFARTRNAVSMLANATSTSRERPSNTLRTTFDGASIASNERSIGIGSTLGRRSVGVGRALVERRIGIGRASRALEKYLLGGASKRLRDAGDTPARRRCGRRRWRERGCDRSVRGVAQARMRAAGNPKSTDVRSSVRAVPSRLRIGDRNPPALARTTDGPKKILRPFPGAVRVYRRRGVADAGSAAAVRGEMPVCGRARA